MAQTTPKPHAKNCIPISAKALADVVGDAIKQYAARKSDIDTLLDFCGLLSDRLAAAEKQIAELKGKSK